MLSPSARRGDDVNIVKWGLVNRPSERGARRCANAGRLGNTTIPETRALFSLLLTIYVYNGSRA